MVASPETELARKGAIVVKAGFEKYRSTFRRITRAARQHFEAADWHGVQRDMVERLGLYGVSVREVIGALRELLGARGEDDALWTSVKAEFASLMQDRGDVELAETFYNSVTRKVFDSVGVSAAREFVEGDPNGVGEARIVPLRTYPALGNAFGASGAFGGVGVGHQILDDYAFDLPYADHDGDARLIAIEIEKAVAGAWPFAPSAFDFVELLEPVFYRNKGAYLVGRVVRGARTLPLIIALRNQDKRIWVDAALLSEAEASIVFSFTRSYFHVDVEAPAGTIRFLKQILPRKPIAELYASLGYDRHGKTELFRDFTRYVERSRSTDRFERARGERGLVMLVFTMPGYDIVLKVVRDAFGPTKSVTREGVHERYKFVFGRDRAGRLVDTQHFDHIVFERSRFEPSLLEELAAEARLDAIIEGDRVTLRHVYTERRVTPLNLYVREAPAEAARDAVLDFGRALRDLGATNIFPGDMLLKNFGVTRNGRVVFYDYDELCLITDVDFRELPTPSDDDDMGTAGEASFYVGPRDVFPEEFINFFGLPKELRELFVRVHGDLLTPGWWNQVKERQLTGEILDVYPYKPARRLHGRVVG